MFNQFFKNKKVLVTGNTGFKGAWLSIWLHHLGADVIGLADKVPTNPSIFEDIHLSKIVKHHEGDIRDLACVKNVLFEEKPDVLFHLAAQPIVGDSYLDPIGTISTNTLGTAHLLEAFRQLEHTCVGVFITSDKCYENVEWIYGYKETDHLGGKDIYSASKGACEIIIHGYFESFVKHKRNLRMASVRAGNVIGGGDWAAKRLVPDCIRAWSNNEIVEIRSPKSTRPWQHVLEPLSGYLRTAELLGTSSVPNGQAYNFGPPSEHTHTVQEILEAIGRYWNKGKPDKELFRIIDNPGFHEAGLLKLNCDKALAELAWRPVLSFEQTAIFTADWYRQFYSGHHDMLGFTKAQIAEYTELAKSKALMWTI